jgi:hypothetical protein
MVPRSSHLLWLHAWRYTSRASSHYPPKVLSVIREPSFLVLLAPISLIIWSMPLQGTRNSSTALIPHHLPPIPTQQSVTTTRHHAAPPGRGPFIYPSPSILAQASA